MAAPVPAGVVRPGTPSLQACVSADQGGQHLLPRREHQFSLLGYSRGHRAPATCGMLAHNSSSRICTDALSAPGAPGATPSRSSSRSSSQGEASPPEPQPANGPSCSAPGPVPCPLARLGIGSLPGVVTRLLLLEFAQCAVVVLGRGEVRLTELRRHDPGLGDVVTADLGQIIVQGGIRGRVPKLLILRADPQITPFPKWSANRWPTLVQQHLGALRSTPTGHGVEVDVHAHLSIDGEGSGPFGAAHRPGARARALLRNRRAPPADPSSAGPSRLRALR